jgi:hypothetical protein
MSRLDLHWSFKREEFWSLGQPNKVKMMHSQNQAPEGHQVYEAHPKY